MTLMPLLPSAALALMLSVAPAAMVAVVAAERLPVAFRLTTPLPPKEIELGTPASLRAPRFRVPVPVPLFETLMATLPLTLVEPKVSA